MDQPTSAQQILCLCCRPEMSQAQDAAFRDLWGQKVDGDVLYERARQEGVAGLLCHHLRRLGLFEDLSDGVREALRFLYYGAAGQHAVLCAQAHRIHKELAASGIVVFFVKGLYLASEVYGNVALRPMTDIDIVVPQIKRRDAWRVLAGMGYQSVGDVEHALIDPLAYSVTLQRREEGATFLVDLHWRFMNARWMRFFLDRRQGSQDIWAASETFFIDALSLETLAADFHLIYIVTHAFSHGFDRLINLADILAFSEKHRDEAFVRRVRDLARDMGLWPIVAYGLFHTARVLGAWDICERFGVSLRASGLRTVYASGLYRRPWLAYLFLRQVITLC